MKYLICLLIICGCERPVKKPRHTAIMSPCQHKANGGRPAISFGVDDKDYFSDSTQNKDYDIYEYYIGNRKVPKICLEE